MYVQYYDNTTINRIERMSDDLTTVTKTMEDSMKRERTERGLILLERFAVEPHGCNVMIEVGQAKTAGYGLRNQHFISDMGSIKGCQELTNSDSLTSQTIIAYRDNGVDHIGKVDDRGEFTYDNGDIHDYRDLALAFSSMSQSDLDQYNYIS